MNDPLSDADMRKFLTIKNTFIGEYNSIKGKLGIAMRSNFDAVVNHKSQDYGDLHMLERGLDRLREVARQMEITELGELGVESVSWNALHSEMIARNEGLKEQLAQKEEDLAAAQQQLIEYSTQQQPPEPDTLEQPAQHEPTEEELHQQRAAERQERSRQRHQRRIARANKKGKAKVWYWKDAALFEGNTKGLRVSHPKRIVFGAVVTALVIYGIYAMSQNASAADNTDAITPPRPRFGELQAMPEYNIQTGDDTARLAVGGMSKVLSNYIPEESDF